MTVRVIMAGEALACLHVDSQPSLTKLYSKDGDVEIVGIIGELVNNATWNETWSGND